MSVKQKNIFLIGFMGVGKSTMGRKIAHKLGFTFIDTDKYIENKYQAPVSDIIYSSGIDAFRKIEHQALLEIIKRKYCVISTGGGMPCFYENIDLMKKNGFVIYISLPLDIIFSRLKNAKTIRPLIQNMQDDELSVFLSKTMNEREMFYQQAHYTSVNDKNLKTESLMKVIYNFLAD